MVRDVKNGCVSGGHSSMDSQTLYQNNVLKPLIIYNNRDDIEVNAD